MNAADWFVLIITLSAIVAYGLLKSRSNHNLESFFLSNRALPWWMVLLGIMGTQASAITFLSAPGQAYTDGMRFVQYYFGLPLAMVVICITFVPAYRKHGVYTPYEFLEKRFDVKTRLLVSILFLLSRGFSTGISVAAPSIILSALFGWNIYYINIFMGGILILYTVSGGARAVAYTQKIQFAIILLALLLSAWFMMQQMPPGVSFTDALHVSGAAGRLNVITSGFTEKGFQWEDKYNIISGIIGGFFLALSYFGTDQSQTGRFLVGRNAEESRRGLLMNGFVKIPMQFCILLLGVLVFAVYSFKDTPVFFNRAVAEKQYAAPWNDSLKAVTAAHTILAEQRSKTAQSFLAAGKKGDAAAAHTYHDLLKDQSDKLKILEDQYKIYLKKADAQADTNDTNYIFLRFVTDYLPHGLIGLLIAVIFLASWGSIAAALNALACSSVIDFHLRLRGENPAGDNPLADRKNFQIAQLYTLGWGVFSIIIAEFASNMGSLIEAVNVLGSLFYGVILGVFLMAFYGKKAGTTAVFAAAILSELMVITLYVLGTMNVLKLGFLWLNVVGALGVVFFAVCIHVFTKKAPAAAA